WLLEAMKLQLESETLVDSIEGTGDISGELPATEPGCSAPSDVLQRSFGACHLYSLPPCLVKDLLYRTLTADKSFNRTQSTTDRNGDTAAAPSSHSSRFKTRRLRTRRKQDAFPHDPHEERPDDGTPSSSADTLFQRQLNGCLGRVPPKFYQSLYLILERSPHGVLIWNKLLPQVSFLVLFFVVNVPLNSSLSYPRC
ncbi:unnamed protein product, partial [Dicrocoelium dendriticum]